MEFLRQEAPVEDIEPAVAVGENATLLAELNLQDTSSSSSHATTSYGSTSADASRNQETLAEPAVADEKLVWWRHLLLAHEFSHTIGRAEESKQSTAHLGSLSKAQRTVMVMHEEDEVQYELVAVHSLPYVDVSRSLKKALLTPAGIQIYKALCKKLDFTFMILYTVAFPIGASVLTVSTKYARVLAIFKLLFQVPVLVTSSAGLRIDLLWCLVRTYEFWFFSIMNALTCIVFSLHLGDLRMVLVPVYWYGVQMNVWADGKVQGPQLASACALAAVYHVFLMIVFGFELTPDLHPFELLSHGGRSMTSSDFLMNTFTTMMVLMARTAYRKRALNKRGDDDPKMLRFVSYRCRVKFQVKDRAVPERIPRAGPTLPSDCKPPGAQSPSSIMCPARQKESSAVPPTEVPPSIQRLRFVKMSMTFNASDILAPGLVKMLPARLFYRGALLYSIGLLGYGLQVAIFVSVHFSLFGTLGSDALRALTALSLALTLLFFGACVACYQRQLMRKLLSSFDFLFLSLQITLGFICLCGMFAWDARCLAILAAWLTLHWILTLDALTPNMKAYLGFRSRYAIPILLVGVVMQLLTSLRILSQPSEGSQARVFWSGDLFGYKIAINAVSFYLSRGFTVFIWSLRILWRLLRSGDDELIMIQGSVEFYANPKVLARKNAAATKKPQNRRLPSLRLGNPRIEPEQS